MRTSRRGFPVFLFLIVAALRLSAQTGYYEDPRIFADEQRRYPTLVSSPSYTYLLDQHETNTAEQRSVDVEIRGTTDGVVWGTPVMAPTQVTVAGASVARLFGAAADSDGGLYLSVLGDRALTVYHGTPSGRPTRIASFPMPPTTSNPQVFVASDTTILLTVEQRIEGVNRVLIARSENGRDFSPFELLATDPFGEETDAGDLNQWNPSHITLNGGDLLVFEREVVFQTGEGLDQATSTSYQFFSTYSDDGGKTWGPATWITNLSATEQE
ncbi:MAG: exo-alpha-sialidase, partial [Spirochaetales bacterium]